MYRFASSTLALLLLFAQPSPAPASEGAPREQRAEAPAETPADRLDERAPRWLSEHDVPSVAVAYVAEGAVQWIRVHGEQADEAA